MRFVLNDKDEWIASFWNVVANNIVDIFDMIDIDPTIEMFYKLRSIEPVTKLDKAFYALFFNRTTFSGFLGGNPIGGKEQKSQWKVNCRWNKDKLKKDIQEAFDLLGGSVVRNDNVLDLIKGDFSSIYLDPPYFKQGSAMYRHFMSIDEHVNLASVLREKSKTCKFVLSYDDTPEIRSMYSWAKINDLSARYSVNGKKHDWAKKNELVITNGF